MRRAQPDDRTGNAAHGEDALTLVAGVPDLRLERELSNKAVSRQEAARPLLTPGEGMQLPPEDELVLVSGCQPIRAKKARYFEDAEMKARILVPPTPAAAAMVIEAASPAAANTGDWAGAAMATPTAASTEDPANAGIRREPELPEQEEMAPKPRRPANEFEPIEDEPQRQRAMQRTMGAVARQVLLDPADDMQM